MSPRRPGPLDPEDVVEPGDLPRSFEISPDVNGYFLETTGTVGAIVVDTTASEITFKWISGVSWPSTFSIVAPSGSAPTTTTSETYEHQAFPSSTTTVDLSTCDYELIQGGTVVGYLRRTSALEWFALPGTLTTSGYFPATTMTLASFSGSGTKTVHYVMDNPV